MTARDVLIDYLAKASAAIDSETFGLGVGASDRREATELVDAAIAEALHAAAERQRAAIKGFDLDDHWAVLYRSEDVDKLPGLIDPEKDVAP
jgi:hypothetical protein